ncbi:MAG TPA: GNAT family N-acetyltransferase [Anaerolineaceae bacterium]|nr:GNAT family N-acetyltransferase [Anaerolineaceae bacterium]
MELQTIAVRRLVAADAAAADRVLMAAFRGEESRRADILRYLTIEPEGWLLALQGEEPVGMVGAVDYGPFAYLGLMAVHPSVHRHGIGRLLLETLLEELDGRGCPMVRLDATEMGAPLYRQFGFVEDGWSARYVWTGRENGRAAMVSASGEILSLRPTQIPAVADFDEPVFGARRERVLRVLLAEFPGRAFVARDGDGGVSGYLIAQRDRLGPWAARDPGVAAGLLGAALTLDFATGPRVLLPERSKDAVAFLERSGFEQLDLHRHMRRGGDAFPGRPGQLYGLASFAIG